MIGNGVALTDDVESYGTKVTRGPDHKFRLLLLMAQGPAGALPEA